MPLFPHQAAALPLPTPQHCSLGAGVLRISEPEASLAERIEAIARYLPGLSQPGAAGTSAGGETGADVSFTMPWFDYINEALAFAGACYANGWVDPSFNWLEWVPQGIRHTDAPE